MCLCSVSVPAFCECECYQGVPASAYGEEGRVRWRGGGLCGEGGENGSGVDHVGVKASRLLDAQGSPDVQTRQPQDQGPAQ